MGRRVRPEAHPVRRGGPLQDGVHGAGLHHRRPLAGSTARTRFRWREKSSTTPRPTALPATDVPAPREVTGHRLSADGERRGDLVDVPRPDDGQRPMR